MSNLTPAQERVLEQIRNAPVTTPDKNFGGWMQVAEERTGSHGYTWHPGLIYGRNNNSATLRALEKKGYIEIVQDGKGGICKDDIVRLT